MTRRLLLALAAGVAAGAVGGPPGAMLAALLAVAAFGSLIVADQRRRNGVDY